MTPALAAWLPKSVLLLRDYDRHIEQLARALETGEDGYVVNYGEWLVPIYRRRRIPMADFMAMLAGLRDACASVLCTGTSQDENGLVSTVAAANPHTAVVIDAGAPVSMPWLPRVMRSAPLTSQIPVTSIC